MGNTQLKNSSSFWIVLGFIAWIIAFFGFLSSRLTLSEDALSYYEHTKFFVENLTKGVFPLWDPFWCHGASNDFFLRRIGAFNPFYSVIVFFTFLKIPYTLAYLWFLALYYWGGMIAFYLLAVRMYENRLIAYAGYLILMFSSLGTRLFDSYMMLVTVPLIWFFYFLVAFTQSPRKHFFLGTCLSFMILSSTYIPFYFLSFLGAFILFFALFYFSQIPKIFERYAEFFKGNKILVILSLSVVLFSFAPAAAFFHNSSKGQIALPARHGNSEAINTLVVPSKTLDWGAVEDILFSSYFSDFRTIKFAVLYIPFFAFIVFILGLFGRLSRRGAFMFTLGFVFFCCIVPRGLPFYDFLYKYVFFLKYFRNLHFFLWFSLVPLFILLILEHWKIFMESQRTSFATPKRLLIYVLSIHFLILLFLTLRTDVIPSTFIMLILSAIFWSLMVLGRISHQPWAFALLAFTIIVQPIEVYHYLSQRAKPYVSYNYHFSYTTPALSHSISSLERISSLKDGLYYASASYNVFYENVGNYAMAKYLQSTITLYDHLRIMDRKKVDFALLESHFVEDQNTAFVFKDTRADVKTDSSDPHPPAQAQHRTKEGDSFKVLSFDANHLKLAIDLPYEKFLVYNDSYDPSWHVSINGQEKPLYQTNVAFKGVWVGVGKNIVEFHYGSWQQYVMNIFLLMASFIFLMGIIYFAIQSGPLGRRV